MIQENIFVILGSQKFQFNRLLKEIDKLVEKGIIGDNVFAQIGYSDYIPSHYSYKRFLNQEEFEEQQQRADIIITHGGTGAIVGAIKKEKKVIAVPRLSKYGEHVDDHQLQLIEQFNEQNLIWAIYDCDKIGKALEEIKNHRFDKYKSNTSRYITNIREFIDNSM